jgi:hypothetical protein
VSRPRSSADSSAILEGHGFFYGFPWSGDIAGSFESYGTFYNPRNRWYKAGPGMTWVPFPFLSSKDTNRFLLGIHLNLALQLSYVASLLLPCSLSSIDPSRRPLELIVSGIFKWPVSSWRPSTLRSHALSASKPCRTRRGTYP